MTAIVGLVHAGRVHLAGDSASISHYDSTARKCPKVFRVGRFVIGSCGSIRQAQLLQYSLGVPAIHDGEDTMHFMVNAFADAIRNCFKSGGAAKKEFEVEEGGCFLVGVGDRLFTVYHDYQVNESILPYAAVGCGEAYCLGSMHSTDHIEDPKARLRKALLAACEFSAGVRPPFAFVSTKG